MPPKVTVHPLSTAGVPPRGIAPDEALIQRLHDSFHSFTARGTELADRFYARLFSDHPEARAMFPKDMVHQKKKLLDTLTLIFDNLRSPAAVRIRIEQLGIAHVGYGVRETHYPWVMSALVQAMSDMAGKDWTSDLHADWTNAIRLVAVAMMDAARKSP